MSCVIDRCSERIARNTARLFVDDKRAFFAAKGHKADEIAARQLCALRTYQGLREKKLKLTDVKEMFRQMRDEA